MNIKSEFKVGARFKLIVKKENGVVCKETPWFDNLVLDTGLNAMGNPATNNLISHICVGSGNSTPNISQTVLDNPIARTNTTNGADQVGANTVTMPYFYYCRRNFRFSVGAAAGNLSEIGLGDYLGDLFNRTLIKDSNGNPATITVLSDEVLDVLVELRVYPALNFSGTFNLLNKLGNIVSTHTYTGNAIIYVPAITWGLMPVSVDSPLLFAKIIQNSVSPSDVSYPNDGGAIQKGMTQTRPNSRTLAVSFLLDLNDGNEWSHKGFIARIGNLLSRNDSIGLIGYKWDINPPIPKNANQTLRYSFELSWGRYTP